MGIFQISDLFSGKIPVNLIQSDNKFVCVVTKLYILFFTNKNSR